MDTVYLRIRKNLEISQLKRITLKDIALVSTTSSLKRELEDTPIYQMTPKDHNIVIIDSFFVIAHLNKKFMDLEFQPIGPTQTIIRLNEQARKPSIFMVVLVWIVLFIGAAMTIMNFHYDVSMHEVQQKLHLILTGEENKNPLWLQVPYSFGIGIGMLLFLNHWFKKRINEEPSPLEIELFNYQQDIDHYVSHHENQLNDENHIH